MGGYINNQNIIEMSEVKFAKYDIIIDINSIRNLNKSGWKIIYSGNKDKLKKEIEKSKKVIISVLGNSNRGKTYLLQKISGENLESGYQIQTKGLSLKIHDNDIILLDTAGTNTPLLIDNELNKRPNQKELNYINLCQIITNYILQTFVVNEAHILICVVGMLTKSEQNFLTKIKKICHNKKKLIIIHNLINCNTNEDIIKYKNEVLLKMISYKLEEKPIPFFEEKYIHLFNKYFSENDNDDVRHFIYGNDKTNNDEMNYYNKTTLAYINKCIKVEVKKDIDIINNLREHIKEISSSVLTTELKSIIESKDLDLIQCKENIEPKEILADELDNVIFVGKEFEPMYRYYKKDNKFIIEIDLCSKYKDLLVKQYFDKITKETIFKISGERILKGKEENEQFKSCIDFINKRETFKKFHLEIKIKLLSQLGIKHVYKEYESKINYGILFLIFKIKI